MKRPSFTPTKVGVTLPDANGALILHLVDDKRNEQMIHLSADLRADLGQRLISGPVDKTANTEGPALYLAPTKTRVVALPGGEMAIELQIGSGRAVHVLLKGLQADALALQIQEMLAPQTPLN